MFKFVEFICLKEFGGIGISKFSKRLPIFNVNMFEDIYQRYKKMIKSHIF